MAIYHLHAKVIQRSTGKNVVASAAYRRATKLHDDKEGTDWDYDKKENVIHSEIIIPENAPDWAKDLNELQQENPTKAAETLWNMVEAREKRVDSQLAREIEFSLPIELSKEQNLKLAREFIQDQFVSLGMIADWSVHWDTGNPHTHVMLTMRELTPEGFGKKVTVWNSKSHLEKWRAQWSEYANFHLRMHGHDVSIDHRSYAEQGIDLVPTIHQGPAVCDMNQRGVATDIMREANEIRVTNLSRISENPNVLLNKMTASGGSFTSEQLGQELGRYISDQGKFSARHQDFQYQKTDESENQQVLTPAKIAQLFESIEHHESVFDERSIAKAVMSSTNHASEFAKALVQIKASANLIPLGPGDDGRERYTTRKMFDLENEIQEISDLMRESVHVEISEKTIEDTLERHQNAIGKTLTEEQMAAVKHALKPDAISCIVGRAGTGKSFSLGALKTVWEAQGLRVTGVALSGIAADGLSKDANINSRTIASFAYAIKEGRMVLNPHDVVVMDEAGMADSHSMLSVLKAVRDARAKLVLVGDHAQIQPVGPGATFRALLERIGFAEIQTIYRQKEEWQREATVAFSAGKVAEGLTAYEDQQCIHLHETSKAAQEHLVRSWFAAREEYKNPLHDYFVIAHRKVDVAELNSLLRAERIRREEISEGYKAETRDGEINISQGDRIVFLKNDRRLGVSNGRFATIKEVDFTESGQVTGFTAILDGDKKEIRINNHEYTEFTHGYAATVHKSQGMTVAHSFVYAGGKYWSRNLSYVAMSRHKETCHLFADTRTHKSADELKTNLGRLSIKDSLLDYPLAFAERRGIETGFLEKLLPEHLLQRIRDMKEKLSIKIEQKFDPEGYAQKQLTKAQEQQAAEAKQKVREDARLVAAYVDASREVGKIWGNLQLKSKVLGIDNISDKAKHFELISGTHEYKDSQIALFSRDEKAAQILLDIGRYEKAIEIHAINIEKLQSQAQRHHCIARVQDYMSANKKGDIQVRDSLAAEIAQDIKAHYPTLKRFDVDVNALKDRAWMRERRLQKEQTQQNVFDERFSQENDFDIASLHEEYMNWEPAEFYGEIALDAEELSAHTQEQRENAKLVAEYVDAKRKVGITWDALLSKLQTLGFEEISYKKNDFEIISATEEYKSYQIAFHGRHEKAAQITSDVDRYENALEAYAVDPNKLNTHAARHHCLMRVVDYVNASREGDNSCRDLLAVKIAQDIKGHYKALKDYGVDVYELKEQAFLYNEFRQPEHETQQQNYIISDAIANPHAIESAEQTLEEILTKYVEMVSEQNRLVKSKHSLSSDDHERLKEAGKQTVENGNAIRDYAKEAAQNPLVQSEIQKLKTVKSKHISNIGGIEGVLERIKNTGWSDEDIQTIVSHLRSKAATQSWAISQKQEQDQGRGGRSY